MCFGVDDRHHHYSIHHHLYGGHDLSCACCVCVGVCGLQKTCLELSAGVVSRSLHHHYWTLNRFRPIFLVCGIHSILYKNWNGVC